MGQDSWNLQYGRQIPAKYRRGTHVDMHSDEGYEGPHVIPGYAGAYKNQKTRVLKANSNPKTYGSEAPRPGMKAKDELFPKSRSKKRK